jgi:hypothetical protein
VAQRTAGSGDSQREAAGVVATVLTVRVETKAKKQGFLFRNSIPNFISITDL